MTKAKVADENPRRQGSIYLYRILDPRVGLMQRKAQPTFYLTKSFDVLKPTCKPTKRFYSPSPTALKLEMKSSATCGHQFRFGK